MANIALEFGANEVEAIGALVHDALVDGPANLHRGAYEPRAEMVAAFGENGGQMARLVDGAINDATEVGVAKCS